MKTPTTPKTSEAPSIYISAITLKVTLNWLYRGDLILHEMLKSLTEYPFLTVKDERKEVVSLEDIKPEPLLQCCKAKHYYICSKDTVICELYTTDLIDSKSTDSILEPMPTILVKFDKFKTHLPIIGDEALICLYAFALTLNNINTPFIIDEIGISCDKTLEPHEIITLRPMQVDISKKVQSAYLRKVVEKPSWKGIDGIEIFIASTFLNDKGLDIHSIVDIFEQYHVVKMSIDDKEDTLPELNPSDRSKFLDGKSITVHMGYFKWFFERLSIISTLDVSSYSHAHDIYPKHYFED